MRVLIIDQYCTLLSLAMRAIDEGHEVKVWMPPTIFKTKCLTGEGILTKVRDWHSHIRWADLIITATNNKYTAELAPLFKGGFPVFGCNPESAKLELDRGHGQEICDQHGMSILPYTLFSSWKDAMKHVEKTMGTFVSKPWGGDDDKSLSYVSKSPEDMLWKLEKWSEAGALKGQIMLQERVKGLEMAVGGWFGPGGWSQHICENFEEKKLMNGGLGVNTGEQGTTLRYVKKSKLFDLTLEPLTGHLHRLGYVGYVDQNCMIEPNGRVWPLEFTMRYGYPLIDIQSALHIGDSMQWKWDLLHGRDSLKVSDKVSVGVVMTHGDFPSGRNHDPEDFGVPIYGLTPSIEKHVHMMDLMIGMAPVRVGDSLKKIPLPVTSGCYIATVTGTADTVSEAQEKAYNVCEKLIPPTNVMYRTDIGSRLEKQLPILQKNGFAERLEF